MQIFANGHGGKHRNTPQANAWRTATTIITSRLISSGQMTDPTVARLMAEDDLEIGRAHV